MSTTIYVVTTGCYSDYRIEAVFSTKEAAEDLVRHHENNDGRVEEYELDQDLGYPKGMFRYQVVFDQEGQTRVSQQTPNNDTDKERVVPYGYGLEGYQRDDTMQTYCWAKDKEHAAKIANERRVQIIAEGKWESNWKNWKGETK